VGVSEHAVPAIKVVGIGKRFGGTGALEGVDLEIEAGTIHALVGPNGAGKSTLLGMLAGRMAPTTGTIEIFGETLSTGDPRASHAAGVTAIYQELTIVPALSSQANVFLGQTQSRHGVLSEDAMRRTFRKLCARLDVELPVDIPARQLSIADQQLLEIMRALQADARIILFDEPTAALATPEREALFRVMRDLREHGVAMIFVCHNLEEVLSLADDVTVFRDGRKAASRPVAEWTKRSLVQAMLGEAADVLDGGLVDPDSAPAKRRRRHGAELIRAEGVSVPGALENAGIVVHAGEIVGVGGLVGSGRSTLLRSLAGLERSSTGELWIDGEPVKWPHKVRQALGYGIALVPEDRKQQGLVLSRSAMENVAIADFGAVARASVISERAMRTRTAEVAAEFGFDPARIGDTARNLSGGNQQKLLLARWSHRPPKVLLADEPTRGIDVGAKAEILTTLRRLADEGLGVVIVSSELEEVVAMADRVVVLAHGRHAGNLDGESEPITVKQILHAAFEVEEEIHHGQG
jgi:ABC-type sugar transport system ATPase subunit